MGDSDGVVMPFMLSMTGLRELQLDRCAIDQSTMELDIDANVYKHHSAAVL